jgi:hypothetical protein
MASEKRASKRPKRSVNWAGLAWLAAGLNIAMGFFFSPATGLQSVQVKGASADQIVQIEKRLSYWRTVPWIRQSRESMVTALLADNRLAGVRVVTNVFGRGRVEVYNRVPVGRVMTENKEKKSAVYLDRSGALYRDGWLEEFRGSTLKLPPESMRADLGIAGEWPLGAVAEASAWGTRSLGERAFEVEMDSRSVISLKVVDGPLIIFGTSESFGEKLQFLDRLLRSENDRIWRTKVINVSAPSRPVFSE